MAFFEDLSRKVQDVAFAAAEKGKEVAAIASEKAQDAAKEAAGLPTTTTTTTTVKKTDEETFQDVKNILVPSTSDVLYGLIDGSVVICGSTELMRLMNVRVPYRLVGKTSVLLAIDGVLYGIFNVKYTPLPQVRQALINLIRSDRHPIFAIRDFNINPEMLAKTFDIATDGYDFPPYVERFKISAAAPGEDSKIAAVVCREGLRPLTHVAETGRKMYLAVRANLAVTLASSLLGLLLVFIKLISTGTVSPVFLLVYMLLSAVPVAVISVAEG